MDIRQGSTIKFTVTFNNTSTTTATSWDDVDNVLIYAYTSLDYVVKFSYVSIPGYNLLRRIDSTHLTGAILPDQSKLMLGELILELCIKDNGMVLLDGGTVSEIAIDVIDCGDETAVPTTSIDGGIVEDYNIEEIGINGTEVGITVTESTIKAEV